MNRKLALAAGAATLLAATAALAQNAPDFTLEPTFGETALTAGFPDDPQQVPLNAGGTVDAAAANLGEGCNGYIAVAPDYRVVYTPGEFPLTFLVLSAADTTLVINGPDGVWYCDDDTWGDLNPRVDFATPVAGQYDVWVGVYGDATTTTEALLLVTEIGEAIPTPAEAAAALTPPPVPTTPVTPPPPAATPTPPVKP